MEKCSRAVPCSHGVVQREHQHSLASHIKRAHPSVHSELIVAGASSQESREERKDAVKIRGEGWCLFPLQPVFCFHVQVRTAATPALAWRY